MAYTVVDRTGRLIQKSGVNLPKKKSEPSTS